jgi:hypothetical protein
MITHSALVVSYRLENHNIINSVVCDYNIIITCSEDYSRRIPRHTRSRSLVRVKSVIKLDQSSFRNNR